MRTRVLCALWIAATAALQAGEASGDWKVVSGNFCTGRKTTTVYRPDSALLAAGDELKGTVYFWKDYTWTGEDLQLVKSDTGWISTVAVPENAALVAYRYYAGDKSDNGGKTTYAHFTVDRKGNNLPSVYAGWGLLRAKETQGYSIPGYMKDSTDMWIDDEVLRFWLNQEVGHNPDERKNLFRYATELFFRTDPQAAGERIRQEIAYVRSLDGKKKLPEIYLYECWRAAKNLLRDEALTQELETEMLRRYPDGIMARDKEIWRISQLNEPKDKEAALDKFLKRFPEKKFRNVKSDMDYFYGQLYRVVVYTHVIEEGNYDAMHRYLHDSPIGMMAMYYWHLVQIPYEHGEKSAAELLPHARAIMNEIFERPRYGEDSGYSQYEWEQSCYKYRKDAYLSYAKILYDNNLIDESAALAEQLRAYYGYKTTIFNDFYVTILGRTGRDGEIIAFIEECIRENAASPAMLDILRKDYAARNGSEKGFTAYVEDLKSDEVQKALKARVMKEMCDEPIQLFEVEALEGHRIDMAALADKIIVLDFWATWCGPCKAAMPGMQMAVDKYGDDDEVRFFFVSTMETDPNFKENIIKFIQEKGYNFQVVFDELNPENDNHRDLIYETYGHTFHFSGIPQKMIIYNGRLRWRSTGYYGSPTALSDEISFIIEYLKNEKQ